MHQQMSTSNNLIDYLGLVPNYIWNIFIILGLIYIVLTYTKRSKSEDLKFLKEEIEKLKQEISELKEKNWKGKKKKRFDKLANRFIIINFFRASHHTRNKSQYLTKSR